MADSDVVDLDLTIDDLVPKSPERYVFRFCYFFAWTCLFCVDNSSEIKLTWCNVVNL